jgi:peptide/nickel transport system permease protein
MIGLIIVTVHICLALAAPTIVPYDPVEFDTSAIRAAPSAEHLFGTDKLGRDVLTRTLLGGRIALLVTMIGTGLAITWGGLLGITLAYLGGITDELVMRMLLSFSARAPFWGLASSRPRRIGA